MTRDKAKKLLPIIKAYSEGKEIQVLTPSAGWVTITTPNFDDISYYRIKPKMTKEEMQEQGLALQSDMDKTIEQNIQLKNQNNWLEGCKLELAEHLGKANDKISELEQQIEKMKCCGNCKYSAQETVYSIVCKVGGVNKGEIENVEDCLVCDKWEIKEND